MAIAVAVPLFPAKQLTGVEDAVAESAVVGCVMVAVAVTVQPLKSVVVTVYVPIPSPERVALVPHPIH